MFNVLKYPDKAPLLEEVEFTANGLFWNGQHVGNFKPNVIEISEVLSNGESETFIRLNCIFTDNSVSNEIVVPLSTVANLKWLELDTRCQINPDCSKASKYLAAIVQADLQRLSIVKEVAISRTGTHFIKSEPVFCVGDRVILSPHVDKAINIKLDSISDRLVVDDSLSELEAVRGMMKIVNLTAEAGRVIFAQCLLGVMRAVYTEVYKPPRCIIYLMGTSGTFKTTYAAFQTQIYDRDKGIEAPVRLNASIPAAEAILNGVHDCVKVLDDLFPSRFNETKNKHEHTLIELVRIVGDNVGRARIRGKGVSTRDPQCGVIVTAEYCIGYGSDAARLLPITYITPIDNVKLAECQSEPLVLSTFYKFYLEWYMENYYNIKDWLIKQLAEHRNVDLGVHNRLQETHFYLGSAFKLFLLYCVTKGFTTEDEARSQFQSFETLLTALVKLQNERVKMASESQPEPVDYYKIVCTLYKSDTFKLAGSVKELKAKHHGFIKGDYLYILSHRLLDEVLKVAPKITLKNISDALLTNDALKIGSDKRTVKVNNIRFYAIPLKKLK